MQEIYKTIIVGAGPAGLFAALELAKNGFGKVVIIDKGKSVDERTPRDTLFGVGGAGLFSDGKLNFAPKIDKTDLTELLSFSQAQEMIDYVEKVFHYFGMDDRVYPADREKAEELRARAKKIGLNLLIVKQKHLGSDRLPFYIKKIVDHLQNKEVEFRLGSEAVSILVESGQAKGIKLSDGSEVLGQNLILAPGRSGNKWLVRELASKGINVEQRPIEIGVRAEVPSEIVEEITRVIYDPTFILRTPSYDDQVRTFCTNPVGFVVREDFNGFACVNGHACKDKHSKNSNFALLDKVRLTEPVTDTIAYGESICRLATTLGGGKPLIQRLGDFRRGRRSNWKRLTKSYIEPTLKDVTPGDIAMAFPYRIVVNIIEALEALDKIIPGLNSDSTLLYAPEAKFFSVRPETSSELETAIKNLFVAGDGAGISGNIVGAAATGIIAARGILRQK